MPSLRLIFTGAMARQLRGGHVLRAQKAGFGTRLVVSIWMALALLGCNVDEYRNVCGFTFAGEIGPGFRPPMAACSSLSAKDYDDIQSAAEATSAQRDIDAGDDGDADLWRGLRRVIATFVP